MIGGNFGSGSYAGGFSTGISNAGSSLIDIGTMRAVITEFGSKKRVRPIDANALLESIVELYGTELDDKTIHECVKLVKDAPTIKKRFGKWKRV